MAERLNAANNAVSTLAADISSSATSLTVQPGDGAKFPSAPFLVTIGSEIIKVGAKSSDIFSSLTRGHEGTTPAAHSANDAIENRPTAGALTNLYDMFGLALHASHDNEESTSSLSAVTLLTISGLAIPASWPILVTGIARKTAGAAEAGQLGFALNATNIDPSGGGDSNLAVWSSSATDRAEHGSFQLYIPPRVSGYLRAASSTVVRHDGASSRAGWVGIPCGADMPTAEITSFGIRGRINTGGTISVFVSNVRLYSMKI